MITKEYLHAIWCNCYFSSLVCIVFSDFCSWNSLVYVFWQCFIGTHTTYNFDFKALQATHRSTWCLQEHRNWNPHKYPESISVSIDPQTPSQKTQIWIKHTIDLICCKKYSLSSIRNRKTKNNRKKQIFTKRCVSHVLMNRFLISSDSEALG